MGLGIYTFKINSKMEGEYLAVGLSRRQKSKAAD